MAEPTIVATIHRYHPEWNPPADNGYEWISTLCPFHQDSNRSASVSYSKGAFHCFACPAGGDVIAIIRREEGVGFAEALRIAETISEGSYTALSRKPRRVTRRRVFGDEGFGVAQPEGNDEPFPVGLCGRSSPWS